MRKRTEPAKPRGKAKEELASASPSSTLARGFSILRAFQPGDRHLGNQELAERVKLPKATVSRLTHTLAELGYLEYVSSIGKYELTPALLSLGFKALSRAEINTLARPMMQQLAEECGCSVNLGVRDRLDMVVIEQARGKHTADLTATAVGRRLPAALRTMGWGAVHILPAAHQTVFFEEVDEEYGPKAPAIKDRMLKAFNELHERGFCSNIGEFSPAYNSVGVSLPSWTGGEPLAFNLAGPAYFLPPEELHEKWGPKLREIALRLRGEFVPKLDG